MSDGEKTDLQMALYFWVEKQNPTRFIGWERVATQYPELRIAWATYKQAVEDAEAEFQKVFERLIENE